MNIICSNIDSIAEEAEKNGIIIKNNDEYPRCNGYVFTPPKLKLGNAHYIRPSENGIFNLKEPIKT